MKQSTAVAKMGTTATTTTKKKKKKKEKKFHWK